jgi:hypothetical protein
MTVFRRCNTWGIATFVDDPLLQISLQPDRPAILAGTDSESASL